MLIFGVIIMIIIMLNKTILVFFGYFYLVFKIKLKINKLVFLKKKKRSLFLESFYCLLSNLFLFE